jgi:hypothetical protein
MLRGGKQGDTTKAFSVIKFGPLGGDFSTLLRFLSATSLHLVTLRQFAKFPKIGTLRS